MYDDVILLRRPLTKEAGTTFKYHPHTCIIQQTRHLKNDQQDDQTKSPELPDGVR